MKKIKWSIYANGQIEHLDLGAQYTSDKHFIYSTSWEQRTFSFSGVPCGAYLVGWILDPGIDFNGTLYLGYYISGNGRGGCMPGDRGYSGSNITTNMTIFVPLKSDGNVSITQNVAVTDNHGAELTCVLTKIG